MAALSYTLKFNTLYTRLGSTLQDSQFWKKNSDSHQLSLGKFPHKSLQDLHQQLTFTDFQAPQAMDAPTTRLAYLVMLLKATWNFPL